jgi:hypothetical protein
MQSSTQFEQEPGAAEPTPNVALVREQLRRLLAHSLFTHSKRYPVLLAFTVERVLEGKGDELKERTIGVEAFGREPSYDVNLDPVVRTTAAEVRKRLVQYYYSPEHAGELVIELPLGSYVPSFRQPAPAAAGPAHGVAAQDSTMLPDSPPSVAARITGRHWFLIALALILAVAIGFGIGRYKPPSKPSNLERFWAPITASAVRVTYCLGEPTDEIDRQSRFTEENPLGSLNVSDVVSLARAIVPLVPRNGAFRVLAASETGFSQLREGPVVLIGAFDNPWTMRITQDLPFGFEFAQDTRLIVDHKSSPRRSWTYQWQVPNTQLARDYAVVARIHDNVTGQPMIILGGILAEGTEAASEVISNPVYLNAMLAQAPKNWDQLNLEAVIETQVIGSHPGPPKIVAVRTW